MSKNILLISETILKARTKMHDNIDAKLLRPDIKVAQDMYLEPILGTALYNKILDLIDDGTIGGNYKDLLDNYIIDALIYYVLADMPMALSLQYFNRGIVKRTGDNLEGASMADMIDVANKDKKKAEFYADKLKKYLKAKATSTFLPEYLNPGSEFYHVHPNNSAFTVPVYLGNDDNECVSYRSYRKDKY